MCDDQLFTFCITRTVNIGSILTGFAASFSKQAGIDDRSSFDLAVGMYALAILKWEDEHGN